jgi:Rrf2 family protein
MLLSTKGDYGVRAMIDLAKHEGEGPVQRAEIARRRQIPESYLDHLLAQLRRAGFVRSVRGPGGGHLLAKPAEDICLLHLLEALEGSLAPLQCLDGAVAGAEAICGQEWVWQEIYDNMRNKLSSVSLAALVDHEREHERAVTINYSI